MPPRFALPIIAAALLAAAPALAQPRPGATPNPVVGPAPAFRSGAADWACHDGRCVYALAPAASSLGWTGCTASWFPTHGGWRKQNICR